MCFYTAALFALVPPTQIWEKSQIQTALRRTDWPLVACSLPYISGFKERNVHFLEVTVCAAGCRPAPHHILTAPTVRPPSQMSRTTTCED